MKTSTIFASNVLKPSATIKEVATLATFICQYSGFNKPLETKWNRIKAIFIVVAILLFTLNLSAQNLSSASADGSSTTTSTSFVDVTGASASITTVAGTKVLVVATFTGKTSSGSADATYVLVDDESHASGEIQRSHSGTSGIGSVVTIFTVTSTGTRTYKFQHKTTAQTLETSVNITAIALYDGATQLVSDVTTLGSPATINATQESTLESNVLTTTAVGGFYVSASIQSAKPSGSGTVIGEWVLQSKIGSSGTWQDISYPVTRSTSGTGKGVVNLVGALPNTSVAGDYYFRVAQKKTSGTDAFQTQACNLVAVALGTNSGFFPVMITSKPSAVNSGTGFVDVITSKIVPQSTTDLFLHSQYNMRTSTASTAPKFELYALQGATVILNGMDFLRYTSSSADRGSGASAGLIAALASGTTYDISLRHASSSSSITLTTENACIVGFGTNRSSLPLLSPITVNATQGLMSSSYSTLKEAFDAINLGTFRGDISIFINASTTESASASLNASLSGSANYISVTIYPTTSGITVSGNLNTSLINLNGADNITIDGRVNATGSTKGLIISNTNTGSSASTLRLTASAQNNTIKYCTLKGSSTNASGGIIAFASSTSGTGNTNNLVDHNDITNAANANRPVNAIYSSGTSGRENSGNIISNNHIYDFLNAASSRGVNISSFSTDWTVSGNSFYETNTIVPTGASVYFVIYTGTSSSHLISGNFIGGSEPECGGSAMTINSSFSHYFAGIYSNGGTTTAVTIQNNTIRNINYTSTSSNPWDGIYLASAVTKVDVTGNIIGATTGTGSITVTTPNAAASATVSGGVVTAINLVGGGSGFTTAPLITFSGGTAAATATMSGGVVTGFIITNGGSGYATAPSVMFNAGGYSTSHGIRDLNMGTVTLSNNSIGSITTIGTAAYSHCFEAIVKSGVASTFSATNNLIGSLSTAHSIQTNSAAASALIKQDLRGIFMNALVIASTISGNTIANLTNNYTGNATARLDGISTANGSNTIQNNIIRNLTTGALSIAVKGIQVTVSTSSTNQTVTGNEVSYLSNTNASSPVKVTGIEYLSATSGTNKLSSNFVHSLSLLSTDVLSEIDGITISDGITTCANNIINLGEGITKGYKIYGIYDNSSGTVTNSNKIYFNTVYLGGTITSGTTSPTGALWNVNNTSSRKYKNNILVNVRTGGTTGKHYAVRIAGTSGLTIDYNNYYVSGTGVLGYISGVDKTTLALWKTATAQDVNSLNTDPLFLDPGDTYPADYFISATLPGITIAGTTADFYGIIRGATPKMGALETSEITWQGGSSSNFGTAANWIGGEVPLAGAHITFAATPTNPCVLDQDRTLGDITNAQSTHKLIANGFKLTLTGNLLFSGGAQIDATATSSVVEFTGTNAQSIPSGAFVSNTIDALTLNNNNGLTLNNDFTIAQALTLTNGALSIGTNTLSLNGILSTISGSLTGGTSSNIVIGGSGAATLPSVVLNNFTLNRSSGVNLGGSLSVAGTIALTSGTLTLGPNTLNVSGSSPTRTTGTIDASNASAAIEFANASAITLPASIFTGNLNNITVSGAGGVTSSSDLTLNGILNLQSTNASSTKGSLDMWDGSALKTLTMGANATTTGIGDVTGIVTRNAFTLNTPYTFGSQYTSIKFTISPLPTSVSFKIILTATHTWKTDAIHRYYDIIRDGGTYAATRLTLNLHYLDAELNGTTETTLDFFDNVVSGPTVTNRGHSNADDDNNWVGLSGLGLPYVAATTYDYKYWTLGTHNTGNNCIWISGGAVLTDWTLPGNWNGGVPTPSSDVIIPSLVISSKMDNPTLPASTTINTLTIEPGGILNGLTGTPVLTIAGAAGAWDNTGTFNAGTSTVIFTNADASMSDPTNFYDVTIADGASLTLGTNNVMRIAGTLSLSSTGVLIAATHHNTVEYNGVNQTIINPNGFTAGYHNLIISGGGIKTMPATTLSLYGDFTISDSTTVTAGAAMDIAGELTIDDGCTFNAGHFNHTVGEAFDNSGTFNASSGYAITLNGAAKQVIYGTAITTFDKLIINNSNGVELYTDANVNDTLTLTSGNLIVGGSSIAIAGNLTLVETILGINGDISKTSGFLEVNPASSLRFGGSAAITLPNNLFSNTPSINNLTVNRSGGVTLGNQHMTVNGLIDLNSGTLHLAANTLTLTGSSPTRTSGAIEASTTGATLEFANTSAITLPTSFITGSLHNLIINGVGGVTMSSNITIDNTLRFDAGLIHTGANNLILSNTANAVVGAASDKYIDGNCRKIGNTAFTFPIGNNGEYAPLGISVADGGGSSTDYFTAYYINSIAHPTYDSTLHDFSITRISHKEYWMLNRAGTNNVHVTLSWGTRSGGVTDVNDLTVARWDGSIWKNESGTNITGDTAAGTITSGLVSSFSPFTLASKKISTNPLPVSLFAFEARCLNNQAVLSWHTALELSNDYFEIESSNDTKTWQVVNRISGAGNSKQIQSYELIDNTTKDARYYRLKQVDFNGQIVISPIIFSNCNTVKREIAVYPIPAKNEIHVSCSIKFVDATYAISNNCGQAVSSGMLNGYTATLPIETLPKGIYILKINGNGYLKAFKIIVDE